MSSIELINGSCADQIADAVVNAANDRLLAGGGICGVIFKRAGLTELQRACNGYKTPLKDGSAVITPAFNMRNAKYIIHAIFQERRRHSGSFLKHIITRFASLRTTDCTAYLFRLSARVSLGEICLILPGNRQSNAVVHLKNLFLTIRSIRLM